MLIDKALDTVLYSISANEIALLCLIHPYFINYWRCTPQHIPTHSLIDPVFARIFRTGVKDLDKELV